MTTTARKLQHKDSYIICRPSLDYLNAQRAYFIYNSSIQSTRDCPTSTFKHAIQQILDGKKLPDDCKKLMQEEKMDMVSRFFILNTCNEIGRPIKLYKCFDDCDIALSRMNIV